jgi:hypothetical protein
MRKIIASLLLLPAFAFGQSFPSPTYKTVTSPATGQFYQNAGASVSRVQDRLFIGNAALNNGTNVASQPDWLTTYQLAKGRTYGFIQTSQLAVLNGLASQDSLTPLVVGAQTTGRTASASQVIAILGMGVNNNSGNTGASGNQAWAGYFEAFRDNGSSGNGGAYGIEIDTMNFTNATPVTDPYSQSGDQTVGAQLASGGGFPGTLFPTTVGLNFQNNNATFDKGIVFGSNAITGDTGTSGSGIAIALGFGHTLQWYGAAATPTSSILSNGTTTANGIQQLFSENSITFNNASGKSILSAQGVASGVNGLQALGSVTTAPPQLVAIGSDTNIDLQLTPKGSGKVRTPAAFLPSTTNGIVGTTLADNANTGSVGEYVTATAGPTSLTSNTLTNITSISLPAGDWEVSGNILFTVGAGASMTIAQSAVSSTSATLPAAPLYAQISGISLGAGAQWTIEAPVQRINVSSTTTVYLVTLAVFSGGTTTATGVIRARRPR